MAHGRIRGNAKRFAVLGVPVAVDAVKFLRRELFTESPAPAMNRLIGEEAAAEDSTGPNRTLAASGATGLALFGRACVVAVNAKASVRVGRLPLQFVTREPPAGKQGEARGNRSGEGWL